MTFDPSILLACRVLGVLVFATAVAGKLRHRDEFVGVVGQYRLLPLTLVHPAAMSVIILEAGAALSLAILPATGAVLAIALLLVFCVAVIVNLARGRVEIDCGCFQSALRQTLSVGLVARNLLLVMAFAVLFTSSAPAAPIQWLDGLAAGATAFLLYNIANTLVTLRGSAENIRKRFS
jgi:hypothetical protein